MCKFKCSDISTAFVSILIGIGVSALAFFSFLPATAIGIWVAVGISVLGLVILTVLAASLLRQDSEIDRCVCRMGKRLLASSVVLLIIAVLSAILFILTPLIFFLLIFLLSALSIYVILSAALLLSCFICTCKRRND